MPGYFGFCVWFLNRCWQYFQWGFFVTYEALAWAIVAQCCFKQLEQHRMTCLVQYGTMELPVLLSFCSHFCSKEMLGWTVLDSVRSIAHTLPWTMNPNRSYAWWTLTSGRHRGTPLSWRRRASCVRSRHYHDLFLSSSQRAIQRQQSPPHPGHLAWVQKLGKKNSCSKFMISL